MNASSDVRLKDLRIRLRDKDYVPLMVGGMGVNISTAEMVLAIEKLGGIAHISDAMAMDLSDRLYGTQFTANKAKRYYGCQKNPDKSEWSPGSAGRESVCGHAYLYFHAVGRNCDGKNFNIVGNCVIFPFLTIRFSGRKIADFIEKIFAIQKN